MISHFIAKKIRREREILGWTQHRLAEEMGWPSHTTVGDIENEKREVKAWELLKLSEIFKVAVESFYRETSPFETDSRVLWRKQPLAQSKLLLSEREVIQSC